MGATRRWTGGTEREATKRGEATERNIKGRESKAGGREGVTGSRYDRRRGREGRKGERYLQRYVSMDYLKPQIKQANTILTTYIEVG